MGAPASDVHQYKLKLKNTQDLNPISIITDGDLTDSLISRPKINLVPTAEAVYNAIENTKVDGFDVYAYEFDTNKNSYAIQSTQDDCFTITEIQAPSNNAQEATLTLRVNGTIPDSDLTPSSFADVSLTYYNEVPNFALVGQADGDGIIPRFSIAFSDGTNYSDAMAINPQNTYNSAPDKRVWFAQDLYIGGSNGPAIASDSKKVVTEGRAASSTIGINSITLGNGNTASGEVSVSLGGYNTASAYGAITIGEVNSASSYCAAAIGASNTASGAMSMALGSNTTAASRCQVVSGIANTIDSDEYYLNIVGNGTVDDSGNITARSNAYALDWSGNGRYSGTLYVGCGANSLGGTEVENIGNKITSLTSSSTDTEYPSAKATYDAIAAVTLNTITQNDVDTIVFNCGSSTVQV